MINNTQHSVRYYLFSLSNFLAAVGGGMILGKGVSAIQIPLLQGSSLLAFFVGTILGLLLLQLTPKKIAHLLARWFSISGGITSFILFVIFRTYQVNQTISGNIAVVFFMLLSLRFGFWFYSRVLRAANAAGQNQNIAWVEFGYYLGIIIGLILWQLLGIDVGMAFALLLDAFLQISAGISDLIANKIFIEKNVVTIQSFSTKQIEIKKENDNKIWSWRLASAVMFLTIGVQVIIFHLAHQVSSHFSPYMLAFFYFGAAISSLFCKKNNIRLEWYKLEFNHHGLAAIFYNYFGNLKKINFLFLNVISAICVAIVTYIIYYSPKIISDNLFPLKEILILSFIFIATFFYGIIEMAILDRIGIEEESLKNKGMVLYAYGLMAISAGVSLWLLSIFEGTFFDISVLLLICFIFTVSILRKRNLDLSS